MGDRCWAQLTVPAEYGARTLQLLKECGFLGDGEVIEDYLNSDKEIATFEDDQVNYGNFNVESALIKEGIPFDKTYGSGGEFSAGTEMFRPADGTHERFHEDLSEGAWGMLSSISDDLQQIQQNGGMYRYIADLKRRANIPNLEKAATVQEETE